MYLVIGAGVSGLTAAFQLAESGVPVAVVESSAVVGGLAASKNFFGVPVDIGSHRIHPAYHPQALRLIKELIGDDLVRNKRAGKILINSKFVQYPPDLFSLLRSFNAKQCLRWGLDLLKARVCSPTSRSNFESFTKAAVGESLYHDFYEPYTRKLWNVEPSEIAIDPALHRVRRLNLKAAIYKLFGSLFNSEQGFYYYPRKGIGQIADELAQKLKQKGVNIYLNSEVQKFEYEDNQIKAALLKKENGEIIRFETEKVISTLSLRGVLNMTSARPEFSLDYRDLKLIYLQITEPSKNSTETFYVPDCKYKLGRISEVAKYSAIDYSKRVLTVEIPCTRGDEVATADNAYLQELCARELCELGIISDSTAIKEVVSILVPDVYPVYRLGWKEKYQRIIADINNTENLYHFGRSALFLHCNIDHCIYMAQVCAQHLIEGRPRSEWIKLQADFSKFSVRE